jgi:hypothetical protein
MKMQLKYMVSIEATGLVLAGFNYADHAMEFCKTSAKPLRITVEGGGIPGRHEFKHCLSTDHENAISLMRWRGGEYDES